MRGRLPLDCWIARACGRRTVTGYLGGITVGRGQVQLLAWETHKGVQAGLGAAVLRGSTPTPGGYVMSYKGTVYVRENQCRSLDVHGRFDRTC